MSKEESLNPTVFENPGVEYRPVPFWGLNDDLDDETLRAQIREMADKGWGGFFTHARYGLETPYLGHEYMDRMRTVVDEARGQGLQAWIYDEHPFPAGTAGGLVTGRDPALRHKVLVMRLHNRLTPISDEESLGYFGVTLDADGIPTEVRPIEDPEGDRGDEHHYAHFYLWTEPLHQGHQPGFSNYDDNIIHGFASSDNLNPAAAAKFIEVTYENFEKAVGDEFGETLKGGFSDIPVYNWNYASPHPSVPWTTGFEKYFEERNGYDILPLLPSLFYDLGDYRRIRIDFWRTVNQRFVESFTRPLYEWFDERGLIYIAHYWGEETLHWQIPWTGDVMSHFVYHHYVGVDHSIRNIEDPLGIKQASTVAEQLGKPRMASETYGMNGNSLSHAERKWMADWEYVLGMNMLIPYVALYSFRGRRKRDEPSSLFIQQAYWPYERAFYDHCARLSYALTRGRRVVDVLVMQPLSHAWAMYQPNLDYPQAHRPDPLVFEGAGADLYEYNQQWMDLCDSLLAKHRDWHVGNETVMAEFGSVDGDRLVVGEHAYRVVVVPASSTWSPSTSRLLAEFAANGGTVLAVEPTATMLDGVPAENVLPAETVVVPDFDEALKDAVDGVLPKDVAMPDNGDILVAHRRDASEDIYFLVNTSLTESYLGVPVALAGSGVLELWDTQTGRRSSLLAVEQDGRLAFELDFYPVSSYLIVRKDTASEGLSDYRALPTRFDRVAEIGDGWQATSEDPNVLVIDYAEVKVGNTGWSERLPMWKAFRTVKQGGLGSTYTVRYRFTLGEEVPGLKFLVENPERTTVTINGVEFETVGDQWWLDPAMRVFDAEGCFQVGENVIELTARLGVGTDVECVLILGDFTVDREHGYRIMGATHELPGRDITKEGFPFFTGSMTLTKTAEVPEHAGRVYLGFERVDATFSRVRVNGVQVGDLPWQPYLLDVTDAVHPGTNEISIDLVTTRHNLFGPHHDRRGDVTKFCAPHIWTNEVMWTDDYYFSPVGVTGATLRFTNN